MTPYIRQEYGEPHIKLFGIPEFDSQRHALDKSRGRALIAGIR
jgi:hypothetical protein